MNDIYTKQIDRDVSYRNIGMEMSSAYRSLLSNMSCGREDLVFGQGTAPSIMAPAAYQELGSNLKPIEKISFFHPAIWDYADGFG